MGLVGKELFDAIAVRVDPAHEFRDSLVHNLDVEDRMLRCDKRRRAGKRLHFHAFHVDLEEVDRARDEIVERGERDAPSGSGTKCVAPRPAVTEGTGLSFARRSADGVSEA